MPEISAEFKNAHNERWFLQKGIRKVEGRPVKASEFAHIELNSDILRSFQNELNHTPTPQDRKLLGELGLVPITGLPLNAPQNWKNYCEAYAIVFDTSGPDGSINTSPTGGRTGFWTEGWVSKNKQIYTVHDEKGIGSTAAAPKDRGVMGPGKEGGIATLDEFTGELTVLQKMKQFGVLVPQLLPPIAYSTFYHNNEIVNPLDYAPDETMIAYQRAWASNVRVSELVPGGKSNMLETESDSEVVTIKLNKHKIRSTTLARIGVLLAQINTVKRFNQENNTNYTLGCSALIPGEATPESYIKAFMKQNHINFGRMLSTGRHHRNLIPHNISLAGEWGDWDRTISTGTPSDSWVYASRAIDSLRSVTLTTAFVESILGYSQETTCKTFWEEANTHIDPKSTFKDVDLVGIVNMAKDDSGMDQYLNEKIKTTDRYIQRLRA